MALSAKSGAGNRLEGQVVLASKEHSEFEALVGTAGWRGPEALCYIGVMPPLACHIQVLTVTVL